MPSPDDRIAVRKALLRLPTTRRWHRFVDPIETHTAWTLERVSPVLQAIDQASRRGLWAVGFISYDSAPAFDSALVARRDGDVPLVAFGIFEHAEPAREPEGGAYEIGPWTTSLTPEHHSTDVDRIRKLIQVGETYQVNLTFRLTASFSGDPLGLAASLIRAQRSSHAAFLDLGQAAICSASPELFLARVGSSVETRPMKGTRPRHPDPTQDRALVEELFRSEKDRAENTMIVDMSRNDLSRIARPGTVKVPRMHHIETYPTVHQMVSSVTAETDSSLMEVLSAAFPAASITGAPKVATTRIIASLEQEARGVYTGAIGHVAPGGSFELNVAIRTAWVDRRKGTVVYGVGGGIVWDSDPAAEWREAMAKARILARAESDLRLLESMAWNPEGGVFLLDRHIERLERTAAHFGFRIDAEEVRRLLDTQRAQTPCSLRLLVDPDGTLELLSSDLPAPFDETVHVVFDDRPVESGDEFLAHKTTRRHRYDEARMRRPDVFDVVLWNERGEVTESTIANVVVEVDGAFVTPPTTSGLLPGTLRAELLATGRIAERVLTPSEMERATRVWLINSVRGWIPIQIDWTTKPRLPISSPQPPVPTPDSGLPPPKSQVPSLKFQS